MFPPSIYAHIANGILLLSALIMMIVYKNKLFKLDVYKKIMMVLIFAIAIGVHGTSHLGLEREYNYNPLQ